MVRLLLILVVTVLVGCSSPEAFKVGKQVESPYGWSDFCHRHPTDEDCKQVPH